MSKQRRTRPDTVDQLADRFEQNGHDAGRTLAHQFTIPTAPLLKLDFGCGPNPREGYEGVDQFAFDGRVKHVFNVVEPVYAPVPVGFEWMVDSVQRKVIAYKSWSWPDNSVEAVHTSHFIEHLDALERVHFVNELWRVLVPGGKCDFIVPHWASCRAYGDPTHKFPPVSEFWLYYLSREWRNGSAAKPCPACVGAGKSPNNCPQCGGHGNIVASANAPHTDAKHWAFGLKCDFEAVWGWVPHPALAVRNEEYRQDAFQWKKEAIQDIQGVLSARK